MHDAVRRRRFVLECHTQRGPHNSHVQGGVGAVEGHQGSQGFLGEREHPPDFDYIICRGGTKKIGNVETDSD